MTIATYTPAGLVASIKHSWNGSNVTLSYAYNQDQQVEVTATRKETPRIAW